MLPPNRRNFSAEEHREHSQSAVRRTMLHATWESRGRTTADSLFSRGGKRLFAFFFPQHIPLLLKSFSSVLFYSNVKLLSTSTNSSTSTYPSMPVLSKTDCQVYVDAVFGRIQAGWGAHIVSSTLTEINAYGPIPPIKATSTEEIHLRVSCRVSTVEAARLRR